MSSQARVYREQRGEGWRGRLVAAGTAVGASRRLPSVARAHGPSHNSLRSLRSLRSDRCDESEVEARSRARPHALCYSAPRKARCNPTPPAFTAFVLHVVAQSADVSARQSVDGRGDFCGGEERSLGSSARSALPLLTRGALFERSERSERSELRRATPGEYRSAVGCADRHSMSRRRAPAAAHRAASN
jgi:hypothetical protein